MPSTEIQNYLKINENLISAGQPSADQLRAVAAEGFTSVINLATIDPGRSLEDEAGLVGALGMNYYHIPVVWSDPQESDFAAFEQLMLDLPPGKTLLHCHANLRATAFYSLYAQKRLGWSATQAEALRQMVWKGHIVPAWETFIAKMTRLIGG